MLRIRKLFCYKMSIVRRKAHFFSRAETVRVVWDDRYSMTESQFGLNLVCHSIVLCNRFILKHDFSTIPKNLRLRLPEFNNDSCLTVKNNLICLVMKIYFILLVNYFGFRIIFCLKVNFFANSCDAR